MCFLNSFSSLFRIYFSVKSTIIGFTFALKVTLSSKLTCNLAVPLLAKSDPQIPGIVHLELPFLLNKISKYAERLFQILTILSYVKLTRHERLIILDMTFFMNVIIIVNSSADLYANGIVLNSNNELRYHNVCVDS